METTDKEPELNEDTGETIDQTLEVIPETITQLAPLGAQAKAVIKAREEIVDTAVRASVRLTHPQDWVLFKDKSTGRVTGFLQDSGCKRIDRLWGIQVTPKSGFEKLEDGGEFVIIVAGDAYCKLTDSWIHDIQGMRSSEEKFAEQSATPLQKLFRVKQGARANLDGNCVRRMSGLQNVPQAFLDECWKGSSKTTRECSLGRGFGSAQERQGTNTRSDETPNVPAPICESCGSELRYVPGGVGKTGKWDPYWKCKDYMWDNAKRVGNGHSRISAADWEKMIPKDATPADGAPQD
jgi:hypothetical protein